MADNPPKNVAEQVKELAMTNAMLRAQQNASIDGVLIVGAKGEMKFLNRRFIDLWEIPQEIVDGKDDSAAIAFVLDKIVDPDAFVAKVEYLYEHWKEESSDEIELKDGRVYDRHSSPVIGDEGVYHGRVWSFRDITQEKTLQAELITAHQDAERANSAKTRFLAHMSHEIRTPLNAIIGFGGLLKTQAATEGLSPSGLQQIDHIVHSSEVLMDLVNDVLDIMKIESGEIEVRSGEFCPSELLKQITSSHKVHALDKEISLELELNGLPACLCTDRGKFRQILDNLIGNGLKFTSEGGFVKIEASSGEGRLRIAVEDSGPGIPLEDQKRIFEPFQQVDDSATRDHGGSGLGLSIASQLAAALGGCLNVRSEVGEGSSFLLDLPLGATEKPIVNEDCLGEIELPEDLVLLVAEDNELNMMLMRQLLEPKIGTFLSAVNGQEAFDQTVQNRPDLVLMDIQMPLMTGIEAASAIRKQPEIGQTKIIALSADAFHFQQEEALEAGFDGYMTKPFQFDELKRVIVETLQKKA